MRWVLSTMKLKPYNCAACGSTPQKEDGTGAEPAAFREGVDINWGDSLYICCSCAKVIGGLFGMMDADEVKSLVREHEALQANYNELSQDFGVQKEKIAKMLEGAKAKRELRAEHQKPKKKVKA